MTRDTKLALIIGFALVMVVGVLISDHLAGTSQTPVADLTARDAADRTQPSVPQTGPPRSSVGKPTPGASSPAIPSQPLVQLSLGSSGSAAPVRTPTHQPAPTGPRWTSPDRAVQPGRPPADAARATAPTTRPRTGPTQPSPAVWHTVRDGESLWSIAQAYYGKGSRWNEIADANPGRIASGGVVRTGVKLKIPGAKAPEPGTPKPRQSKPRTPEPASDDSTRTYTVKAGDTLSGIAQSLLGTIKRADEIIELNAGTITNADEIREGMTLRIPAR